MGKKQLTVNKKTAKVLGGGNMHKVRKAKLSTQQVNFLKNIAGCDYNVSRCCDSINISRNTFYYWNKVNPTFAAKFKEIEESQVTHVESKLMERINGVAIQATNSRGENYVYSIPPDTTAIKTFLAARAKHRGYGDEIKINTKQDHTLEIRRTIIHRTAEEFRQDEKQTRPDDN